jgi:Flp pilus assembly protein TadG
MMARAAGKRRTGAAAVETAFVLIPIFMFFGGVFEYGRFLMDRQVVNNAAREGCRFALANNTDTQIATEVTNVVNQNMAGRLGDFSSFSVSLSGTHNGVNTPVNNLMPGDMITVQVTSTFHFMDVIPILPMPTAVPMNTACTMIVEGGT